MSTRRGCDASLYFEEILCLSLKRSRLCDGIKAEEREASLSNLRVEVDIGLVCMSLDQLFNDFRDHLKHTLLRRTLNSA